MTFNYRPSVGSLAVTITVQPAGLLAPWSLEGPNGFVETGSGDAVVLVWDAGTYTLTWEPVPGWSLPDVPVVSGTVTTNGPPLPLGGTYLDPPFVATSAGALGDAGLAAGSACWTTMATATWTSSSATVARPAACCATTATWRSPTSRPGRWPKRA